MPAWTWWVVAAWVIASIVAAPIAGRFIGFGDSTPTDREV